MTTPSSSIDPHKLSREALSILTRDLEGFGNVLNDWHRAALLELVETFSGYCVGTLSGRKAFPLPTGMGKTSAVVAFVAALHRLGYEVPISVAASRVEALCRLKRELLAHGIPETLIGLKHADPDASEPSTGSESRLVQLVTHARVRSGRDFELFGTHQGHPRALCIYDETFMRVDAFAFSARGFYGAVYLLAMEAESSSDPLLRQLVAYLQKAEGQIKQALADLASRGDENSNGAAIELDYLEPATIEAFKSLVPRYGRALRGFDSDLRDLLTLSQDTLRVVGSEQGNGIVTSREAVPADLRNVVILDASSPIRELAKLDRTVEVVESFDSAHLKSFEQVEVRQFVSPGGKSSMVTSMTAARREASSVAREVAAIIREGWETETAFLVFTFLGRGEEDLVASLRRDLRHLGIDVEAVTAEGKPRINWLTWGKETSLNGLEFCTSVIMAGVLHRSHLDLSAVVKGQTRNPSEPTPSSRIRELIESEIASCIYQGASRGSCRRIDNGKAKPMRLWFIHKNPGIRTLLDRVMPGAVWSFPEPQFLKKAVADTKVAQLLGALLGHLRGLPETVQKISTSKVKQAMGLPKDKGTDLTFSRAVALLDPAEHGWALEGRSLVRGAELYGFTDQS